MNRTELDEVIKSIKPADRQAIIQAKARQAQLAKPPGSLGGLEEMSVRIAGMTGQVINRIGKGCVAVFCADNGVTAEGVASAPQSVTRAQTINFTRRLTGVGALAKSYDSELLIVDMGVKERIPAELYDSVPLRDTSKIVDRRIRPQGETDNIAAGPAMTQEEALQAIAAGIEMAEAVRRAGFSILGVGEMGIGNTSTSSAVLSALLGLPARQTVSRGAGINDSAYARKIALIDDAIARWQPDPSDPVDVLMKVGGFDLAAMCGAFLGAAAARLPAVIDGFISAVAALCAYRLNPLVAAYMIPSHASAERGYRLAMEAMGLEPMLLMNMRLGEGSGCPIAFELVAASQSVIRNMATFEEAAIDDGYLAEIRGNKVYQGEA